MPNTSVDPDPISAAVDISTESTNEIIRIGNSIGTTELDIDSGSRGIDIKSWSGGDINLYASTGNDPTTERVSFPSSRQRQRSEHACA